jgi:hypothetical protein
MLVACRLASLSALETYYAGVRARPQFGADVRGIVGDGGNTSACIGRLADGSERGTKRGSGRPA